LGGPRAIAALRGREPDVVALQDLARSPVPGREGAPT
jgi:hypothetical protein